MSGFTFQYPSMRCLPPQGPAAEAAVVEGAQDQPPQHLTFDPMNPPEHLIRACNSIAHCLVAAGLYDQGLQGTPPVPSMAVTALYVIMGLEPASATALLAVKPEEVTQLIGEWVVPTPAVGEQAPGQRRPNFGERSKLSLAVRFANMHCGMIPIGNRQPAGQQRLQNYFPNVNLFGPPHGGNVGYSSLEAFAVGM